MFKKPSRYLTIFIFCVLFCLSFSCTTYTLTWDGASASGGVRDENSLGAFEVGWLEAAKAVG